LTIARGMDSLEPGEWLIGLASWVIQDGNDGDFEVGQRGRFAVGFFADDLREPQVHEKAVASLGEGRYEICGQVVVAQRDLAVLDFGLLAYADGRPPTAELGDWRAGRLSLEVDCYSYFEIHATKRGVPPAVYAWTITGIWRQTAPYIPDLARGDNWLKRDPERAGWAWLDRTAAWSDDDGQAEYVLRCRLESDPPTRHP